MIPPLGRPRFDLPELSRRTVAFGRALSSMLRPMQVWSLWVVLSAGLALGLATVRTPPPHAASASSALFSAERAMKDVAVIGREPHPTGSPRAEEVRRYLFQRLQGLGLDPQMRLGEGVEFRRGDPSVAAAAEVQNILAALPGSNPTLPAVLLMAHSDSTPNSAGAADDGAGVATLLETARSLTGDAPHERTVLFLLTDGEEAGLLGARAFFATDPAAKRVGVVLNLEARGDAGRTAMFQLGPRSDGLLRAYGQEAAGPFANSLTGLLFKILPNDTDFTVSLGKDLPGLNFAFIGDQLAYHTPLATPEHLSRGSLQSMGGQVLPLTRALADAPVLPAAEAPAAYADLFGMTLLILPFWAGALMWAAAALLFGFAAWRARRQGLAEWWEMARGAGAALLATVVAALALQAAGALLGSGPLRVYALVGRYELLFAGCGLLATASVLAVLIPSGRLGGFKALAAAVLLATLLTQVGGLSAPPLVLALVAIGLGWATAKRPCGPWATWLGALALGGLIAGLLQVFAPGAAPLVLFPLLLGAMAAALAFATGKPEWTVRVALIVAGLLAVVVLGWLCGWTSGLFVAAGPFLPAILAPFALLILMVAAPFARLWASLPSSRWVTGGIAAVAVGLLLWVGLAPPTAARPRPTAAYVLRDGAKGPALIVTPLATLDPWTRRLMPHASQTTLVPIFTRPVWTKPLPGDFSVAAPAIDALRVQERIIVHVRSTGGARRLTLWVRAGATLSEPRLNGRPFGWAIRPNRWSRFDFHAPPPEGFTVSMAAAPGAEIEIVAAQLVDGWPTGAPVSKKPPGYMAFGDSDTSLGVTRLKLRPEPREVPDVPPEALKPDRGGPNDVI